MLDKLSRNVLDFMLKDSNDPAQHYYNFQDDIDRIAAHCQTTSETIRAAIRYLHDLEYIKYLQTSSGLTVSFYLDHQGLHWREFRRAEIIEYIQDKWIDCLSLLISFAALIISIIALWPKGSG